VLTADRAETLSAPRGVADSAGDVSQSPSPRTLPSAGDGATVEIAVAQASPGPESAAPAKGTPRSRHEPTDGAFEPAPRSHALTASTRRARLDLPERCTHWLSHLLARRLPPARVLELGCAHGGYVALLGWAGFTATGTEMSPWVVEFSRQTFGIDALAGPIETQPFAPGSFDVIVLNDVLEHLPTPAATLAHCARLLAPDGFFVIQTPEYKEHLTHGDLVANQDIFLRHMDGNNDEHLYLYSRRSATEFFTRLGFSALEFANPVYSYDLFFTAARAPLVTNSEEKIAAALATLPTGRLVQALLDQAAESTDRSWAIQRLETALAAKK
jgi:2-polyprenyl-3-methyl-5-hydroxy-6-metoxy-1,4-benzoquinol methylase